MSDEQHTFARLRVVQHPDGIACYWICPENADFTHALATTYPDKDGVIAHQIVRAVNQHAALRKCAEALRLSLPLAKGYARRNRVAVNARIIGQCEAALAALAEAEKQQ